MKLPGRNSSMLDNKGFDLWADGYDKSVQLSEENNEYPFAGYKNPLEDIFQGVLKHLIFLLHHRILPMQFLRMLMLVLRPSYLVYLP